MPAFMLMGWALAGSAIASINTTVPYSVRIWQTDDGLPQNPVYAIAQTQDGYLWIGTHGGLARFDGLRFTVVADKAVPGLRHAWITALAATRDGSLWIAGDGCGLFHFKDGAFTHFSEAEGLPGKQPRCLLEAKDGALWIGGEDGLSRYQNGKFANFTENDGLGSKSVRALCEDRQGAIRVATGRGLSGLNQEGSLGTIYFGAGATSNSLKSVCEDRSGRLWVASPLGVTCLEENGRVFYGVSEGLPGNLATVICQDRSGEIWVGTYNGLAGLIDGKVVSRPMTEAGFGDLVYTIFEDQEENLWVGARDGLYRIRPARLTAYTRREGLSADNVMSICEDRSGAIWIATWGGGVNRLMSGNIKVYDSANGLTHDQCLCLHQGQDESLWIGMDHGGGLNRLTNGSSNLFPRQPWLGDVAVRVIHQDRKGSLWIGTHKGLYVLKPKTTQLGCDFMTDKVESYTPQNGLAGGNVMAICEDHQGQCWVGTDGGLSCWEGASFVNYTTRQGLSDNAVDAIYEDSENTLWIGTKSGGLNRFKTGRFTAFTSREGLFSDEIYEIVEDDFGYFWMSCRNGIFRVSKSQLEDFARGAAKSVTSTSFGKADGLLSVQCNGVAKPAGWKGNDGRLWFPTIRGAVAVQSRIKTNDRPPPLVIEHIVADNKRLSAPLDEWTSAGPGNQSRPLSIPPGRGEIEIQYTALSFQGPEKIRFKYMLEGINSGWVDAGTLRAARYNNIGPGTYTFRVIACNNDGVWNDIPATVTLHLLPHFWQRWTFKLALGAAFGLILGAVYRARVARLREIERLRIQIAADLHDDVGSRLTKVAMVTEMAGRQISETDTAKPFIQNISATTREIIQAMDEIVWTINPRNDTLDNLANYIFQYAQEYFQNTAVRCRLDFPAHLPDTSISTQERHNLFMAVKEALNNALKHAQAGEVRIGLAATDGRLSITITDNGRGFSPDQALSSGNGLRNMKLRLERIGGRLVLESKPSSGTTIRMEAVMN